MDSSESSIGEIFARVDHLPLLIIGLQAAEQRQPPSQTNQEVVVLNAATQSLSFIHVPAAAVSDKSGPLPASKASIDAMPRITVTEDCVKDCAICLDEMSVGGVIREMPCKHGFHSGCIEKWLGLHRSCPVCRFMMPTEDDGTEDDGDGGSEDGRRQRRRIISYNIVIVADSKDGIGGVYGFWDGVG
ncbi:hypothetical protein GH714_012431 [Hevea brasiliensis]|uniref:RING-type E3 ubiquitin transferase n=1 Tax=Hevea brasiliensis TaxID=3981 RepID=A0A6A6MNT6_HEVBR|nr:hypothetical protein GH714_012431 [Hevea brasiliensis]